MDSSTTNSVTASPAKILTPKSKPKLIQSHKDENQNPNLNSPSLKLSKSSSIKSYTKTPKSTPKYSNPNSNSIPANSPKKIIGERKFVVAKRISKKEKADDLKSECNCKDKIGSKCLCVAYKTLRASQEEFFKPQINDSEMFENSPDEVSEFGEMGGENNKRGRDIVPETGSGKVMSLIKAFERLKTATVDSKDVETLEGDGTKGVKLEFQIKAPETQISSSSTFPSNLSVSSSFESSQGSFTFSSKGSCVDSRSQRNSTELSRILGGRRRRKQQLKATRQQPFNLLTEQRGRNKEEEFLKKLQEIMIEEQKQRIPIAQGLPWTTDEPENLVKPPVKDITIPLDLVLHTDVRAEDRAEFDRQLAEKEALIEQIKMERERQQKLAEEEEIRRLRKELIPKAQPMPYFDRPFIPKRSEKHPTIPKEPKFHISQHKRIKSCLSWSDFSSYQQ